MPKRSSFTHHRRLQVRNIKLKAWPDLVTPFRAFSNTEGDRGDDTRGRGIYYEAVTVGRAQGLRTLAPLANQLYLCTRVFTRDRLLPLIIGGSALEAAQTAVWLGTNKQP